MADKFDLIVIGAGPGGYVAAIRAAQLGMKVACVEKRDTLGGTCLNVGCIPSKALLTASEKYHEAKEELDRFGVDVGSVKLDLKKMMGHKDDVVKSNVTGVAFLFKKNKITWLKGLGTIPAPGKVQVEDAKGKKETYETDKILIATGSDVMNLPGVEIDEKQIVSSTGALDLAKVPKTMVVIGGGYIGLEMGSVWSRLGTKVTVVEFLDKIVPTMDEEVGKQFHRILGKQGIEFKLKTKVTAAKAQKSGVKLTLEPAAGGDAEEMKADVVLVAIGRRPLTDNLGLDKIGVETDKRGFIAVDEDFQTNVEGIYAIGDAIPGPMLAHKAEEDGMAAVEIMAGQSPHVDYNLVPGIVYTWPEVASIGKTEQQLKADGVAYKVGKFPFSANGRARAMNATDGFVKILADKETDKVLGCHILGPNAGDLIHEVATAAAFGASAEDIAMTCHGHPTLNEAVKEAALAVDGRPIHI
ncbi:MAG: dihydrolipoyl dehydrogenase [Alphaproteobacteria bacterium]|nr:dihydrolipoyl dehydrogenase [Alphaproteobacteria bacterium]